MRCNEVDCLEPLCTDLWLVKFRYTYVGKLCCIEFLFRVINIDDKKQNIFKTVLYALHFYFQYKQNTLSLLKHIH